MSSECAWTRTIQGEMEACGAYVRVLPANVVSSGLPDRLVTSWQFCGLLEFKDDHTRLRENQSLTLKDIKRRNKVFAFIIRKPYNIESIILEESRCTSIVANFDGTGRDLLEQLRRLVADVNGKYMDYPTVNFSPAIP